MKKVLEIKNESVFVNDVIIKTFRKESYKNAYRQILEFIEEHQESFKPKTAFEIIFELENYDYIYVVIYQLNKATKEVFGVPLFLEDSRNRIINPALKKKKMIKVTINLPTEKYEKFLNEYKDYVIKENR